MKPSRQRCRRCETGARPRLRARCDGARVCPPPFSAERAASSAVACRFFHTSPAERELILQMQPPPTKLERVASDAVDVSQTVVVTLTSEED